uniref:Peptidase S1 domain-containing protein n=1 Tax=Pelusios castaneus TaxID=367368 RepID=A0A8C8VJ75_9SAUR
MIFTTFSPPGEIIGGHEARPHSRPYMAHLETITGAGVQTCGGFLIRNDVVLTAAHCNNEKGDIIITLGAHDLRLKEESQQVISVRRQILHPQYDAHTLNNDIMLLQLVSRAQLNSWVQVLALPKPCQHVCPGATCSVAGWGRTSARRWRASPTLQEVDVVVMEDTACQRNPDLKNYYYNGGNPSSFFSLPASCFNSQGDSGGPLMCEATAQGIVSWGSTNGTPPGVYTRVSGFVPWILETMRKLEV